MASQLVIYRPRPMPTLGADRLYLQQELSNISNASQTAAAAIQADETTIASHTSSIATNTTNIATNTTNIATNTTNIAAHTASIAAHEAAWTTWAPTVTPETGAFGSASAAGAYIAIGKTVHFAVTITITTAGTAAGDMVMPLPIGTAKRPASVVVTETNVVGSMGFARIATSGTTITNIRKYDNTTYIGTGHVVTLSGSYERT